MLKKILLITLCICSLSTIGIAKTNKQVEVFDCTKQAVIAKYSLQPHIEEAAILYAKSITGVFKNVNAIPKDGFMIKVPLSSQIPIQNRWIYTHIDEVMILLPKHEPPYIMIYDDENTPHFYYVKNNPKELLKKLHVNR
ncbi:hypothetical protein BAMA_21120 [Bacillus manliponensis]|uniref:Group-specific protein n=1 Tax=Bacillus manliponensis TaxID=574376 RepID=A0A073JZS5_9BACI|nr:hypothetical protein [Bacillus manliponensis]KEK19745.1 hypothetical protein BAMA_21120 [Bacillus manliponensis]